VPSCFPVIEERSPEAPHLRLANEFWLLQALRQGLSELRVDWGPGHRVYHAMVGRERVLLLCSGDKRKQSANIDRALECLQDYKERTGTS
jgi:putative addiction module killer protein